MPPFVLDHLDEIRALCDRYGVLRLDLFGSAATDRFDPETSDLDFVVDFADRTPGYAGRYLAVAEGLEAIFQRDVDLVTEGTIRSPRFRRNVEAARTPVVDRDQPEVVATSGWSPRMIAVLSVEDDVVQRLRDAREAAVTIQGFIDGMSLDDDRSSLLLRSGVERQLGIVGEAPNHAATMDRGLDDRVPGLRGVVALRHRLVHGYRDVNDEIVWELVRTRLPDLIARLDAVLSGHEPADR